MRKGDLSVLSIVNEHLIKYPATYSLKLTFNGVNLTLFSNSETLVNKLSQYYGNFKHNIVNESDIIIYALEAEPFEVDSDYTVRQPDPGKKKIKEEYIDLSDGRIVRKRLTGMQFVFGKGKNLAVGPSIANSNQVVNFINNRYIEWLVKKGYLLAHAAGVIWGGKGIAISGFAGMGKSTLALKFMNKGATFVSNDRLLFKKNNNKLHMIGVPKLPRVNPGTVLNNPSLAPVIPEEERIIFSNLPEKDLWKLEYKYDVEIDKCFGMDKISLFSDVDLVICLNWDHSSGNPRIDEVNLNERRDLLRNLIKPLGLFFEYDNLSVGSDCSEEEYIGCLEGAAVVEIGGGIDFDYIADECIRVFKHEKMSKV